MKRSLALLASTALLLPAAALAAPAEAAEAVSGEWRYLKIKNCSASGHGTTVRARIRITKDYTRVRISHPDGRGDFRNTKVKRVSGVVDLDFGTANSQDSVRSLAASHRLPTVWDERATVTVLLKFTLRNGKSIGLRCQQRYYIDAP